MKKYIFTLFIVIITLYSFRQTGRVVEMVRKEKPSISFTFDDGDTLNYAGYDLKKWNEMILTALQKNNLKTIFFVTGKNKLTEKGQYVLQSWDDEGHTIGNHTFSHINYSSNKTSIEQFKWELLKTDTIISNYKNYKKIFRFPYLKEGDTEEKIEGFKSFLNEHDYINGKVSIDASDWYINSRLVKRLVKDPRSDISGLRKYYLDHLLSRANFYDSLAYQVEGRHVKHVLLLHHNLAAALFLEDLIKHFKANGWNVISATDVYLDEIYKKAPKTIPAGESIVWALAKQTGKFEKVLRYPPEDGIYEKESMDKLGL